MKSYYEGSQIFVIAGRSCAGKDGVLNYLQNYFDLVKMYPAYKLFPVINLEFVSIYTTRMIRPGEYNEYKFVTDNDYKEFKEKGEIVDDRSYETVDGIKHYFVTKDLIKDKENTHYVMISTLEGVHHILDSIGKSNYDRLHIIYLKCSDETVLNRYMNREKNQKTYNYREICRRFLADSEDYSEDKVKQLIHRLDKCHLPYRPNTEYYCEENIINIVDTDDDKNMYMSKIVMGIYKCL